MAGYRCAGFCCADTCQCNQEQELNNRWSLCAVLLSISLTTACSPSDAGREPAELKVVSVEALGAVQQDAELLGRDGGYTATRQGQTVWVFGDSVFTVPNANGDTFISNTWSLTNDTNAGDGIDLSTVGRDEAGRPVELFPYTEQERQFNRLHAGENCIEPPCQQRVALWPAAVIDDPDRSRNLVFYNKIAASPGAFNFQGSGQSIAVWPYDTARPYRPVVNEQSDSPTILFPVGERAWGNAAMVIDDTIYAFACTRDETVKPCRLARVPLANALEPESWEYFNGRPDVAGWNSSDDDAAALFNGNDILSIHYNQHFNRYVALYSRPISADVELRTAEAITGPWTEPVPVITLDPGESANGWIYDALVHPEYSEENGAVLYFTYSVGTGFFRSELRLVRVRLDRIGADPG